MFKYSELIKNNIKYKVSTIALYSIIALSLMNIFTIVVFGRHIGFSFYITNIFADFSRDFISSSTNLIKEIVIVIITVLTAAPYIICAIFSRKRPMFTTVAAALLFFDSVLFCIDFISLMFDGNFNGTDLSYTVDFIIRIVAGVIMVMYVLDGRELWYTVKDADTLEEIFGEIEESPLAVAESNVSVRKALISRKNELWGFLTNSEVIIDGESRGFIKNGKNKAFDLTVSAHELIIIAQNGVESDSISIENGKENVVFSVSVKPKLFKPACPIIDKISLGKGSVTTQD